jgi:hypothetical protein
MNQVAGAQGDNCVIVIVPINKSEVSIIHTILPLLNLASVEGSVDKDMKKFI